MRLNKKKYFIKGYMNLLIVILIAITYYKFVDNLDSMYRNIGTGINRVLNILKPFLGGLIIAYILDPLVKWIEFKLLSKIKGLKYKRAISIGLVILFIGGIVTIVLILIIPATISSIKDLVNNLPKYINKSESKILELINLIDKKDSYNFVQMLNGNIKEIFTRLGYKARSSINNILDGVVIFTSKTLNILLACIVSFYVLIYKEKIINSTRRILRAYLDDHRVDEIEKFIIEGDKIFVKYVIGKSVDSLIIGIMAFGILTIIKSPYVILISIVVTITNMIPYFGPLIGMVVGFMFVSFYSSTKALWVLILLFFLQQFDSFYLTPKILGDKIGINPIWIIFSIILGGSLFGLVGMFLGVPVISIILVTFDKVVEKRLKNKNNIRKE
ncbi:MAG: AI-2E family transporter [Anaeromicrobium sp.]|uniref:AI-2E family transporter n=1 Tax=Anaeromicrobium sp. TaxID=1929132 RepID=UPI0025D3DDAE|nr:AI-2E family transporter [Anaeromicrobium sp.]MCT4594528.1 AI-2E family transporter [Anaeromicrobium sp.]